MGEQRVADWLSRNGIPYRYEPEVAGYRPDFALVGVPVVIEYWGGAGYRAYAQRMEAKTRAYSRAGYQVVHLLPVHLWELERELARRLEGVIVDVAARDRHGGQ